MNPVEALARVDRAGAPLAIHLLAPVAGAPLALELVRTALVQAAPGDGVFRVVVSGTAHAPSVDITRVASTAQHFLCATVEREDDEAVRIGRVFLSPAPGATAPTAERTGQLLAEAAAAAARRLSLHTPAVVELVLDA